MPFSDFFFSNLLDNLSACLCLVNSHGCFIAECVIAFLTSNLSIRFGVQSHTKK